MSGFMKKFFGAPGQKSHMEMKAVSHVSDGISAQNGKIKVIETMDTNRLDTNGLCDKLPIENDSIIRGFNNFKVYSGTSTGIVRDYNQDAVYTCSLKLQASERDISAAIGIVADGMGGLSMGEVASTMAVSSISAYFHTMMCNYVQGIPSFRIPHSSQVLKDIGEAMRNTNRLIYEKGKQLGENIGTTLTGVLILGNVAYFGHAGDSRAYIINTRNGTMDRVSRDHSLVERLIEMGQITKKEAKKHPRRNEIYKMLGLNDNLEPDTYYRIIDGSSIIILMSDGLWEMVEDDVIADEMLKNINLSSACNNLVCLANKNGGHDNISIVVVKPDLKED